MIKIILKCDKCGIEAIIEPAESVGEAFMSSGYKRVYTPLGISSDIPGDTSDENRSLILCPACRVKAEMHISSAKHECARNILSYFKND